MKPIKLLLLGIAIILFGISAALLSGSQGTPTFGNGIYELLGVICPIAGVVLSVVGFACKDKK